MIARGCRLALLVGFTLVLWLATWRALAQSPASPPIGSPVDQSIFSFTVNVDTPVTAWLRREPRSLQPQLWLQRGTDPPFLVWRGEPLTHVGRPQWTARGLLIPLSPTGNAITPYAYTVTVPFACFTGSGPCRPERVASPSETLPPVLRIPPLRSSTVITPPRYIRVQHDPRNPCRQAKAGQIDVIPFEEYVARVLPAEMPAGWPPAALQAQAIAIRTYAWYQILQNKPDFDVTDWTDFQVMCDDRYPSTDQAVAATAGQALFFNGLPILAMYSAQNGHPTRGVSWLPYLTPVPDPVSLGEPRRGHGLGLSQWGAKRWAERGWNAYQILAHYYPDTELYLPPPITVPTGTLLPLELEDMTLGRGYPIRAWLGRADRVRLITVTATTREGLWQPVLTATAPFTSPWLGVWIPPDTFSSPYPITLTAVVRTRDGLTLPLGTARVWRDLRPLTVTLTSVTLTVKPRVPITVTGFSPPQSNVRLGVGAQWVVRATEGTVLPAAGVWITDTAAGGTLVWQHRVGDPPATWHSPPVTDLPRGRSYRAWFRLRAAAPLDPNVLVYLDVVTADGTTLLGMRAVRGIEFRSANTYQEYPVDFHLFEWQGPTGPVVFRVRAYGRAEIALERVLITEYPRPLTSPFQWDLPQRPGRHTLIAKATTPTGFVTPDHPLTLTLRMPRPPLTITLTPPYTGWITSPLTLQGRVTTAVAAPDLTTFAYRYTTPHGLTDVHPLSLTDVTSRTARFTLPVTWLPEGQVTLSVHGQDRFTYRGASRPITLSLDLTPPQVELIPSRPPNAVGWYTAAVSWTLTAVDAGSGVDVLTLCITPGFCDDLKASDVPWTFPVDEEGRYTFTVHAQDVAGHTRSLTRTVAVDLAPPVTEVYVPSRVRRAAVKVQWQAQDTHPIVGYDLQVWSATTGWQSWLTRTQRTRMTFWGEPGATVAFRARAYDIAGWTGAWSSPVTLTLPYVAFFPHLSRPAVSLPRAAERPNP